MEENWGTGCTEEFFFTTLQPVQSDFHFEPSEVPCTATNTTHNNNNLPVSVTTFRLVQCVVAFVLNTLVVALILSCRKLVRKRSTKFFINLQAVHLILCVLETVAVFHVLQKEAVIVSNGLLVAMFLSMVVVTMDRFILITYPYRYEKLRTYHVAIAISTTWAVSVAFVVLAVAFDVTQHFCTVMSTTLIAGSSLALSLSNLNIYRIAQRHAKCIQHEVHDSHTRTRLQKRTVKNLKSLYVSLSIVLSFVVLWSPFFVHNLLVLTRVYVPGNRKLFTQIVEHVALLNCIVDPVLFVVLSKDVKRELRKLQKCGTAWNSSSVDSGNSKDIVSQSSRDMYLVNQHDDEDEDIIPLGSVKV